jgi:hypothetical protein
MSKQRAKGLSFSAVTLNLEQIDGLEVDSLVLGVFQDDRPVKGAAGFCDWRLNGRISNVIQNGTFGGTPKETLLMDTNGRIMSKRLLLFGMGQREDLNLDKLSQVLSCMLVVAKKAKFSKLGLELPGFPGIAIKPAAAIDTLLDRAVEDYPDCTIRLLCHDKKNAQLAKTLAEENPDIHYIQKKPSLLAEIEDEENL